MNDRPVKINEASDRKLRIECLKLAVQLGDPDNAMTPAFAIQQAETLYRYVVNGPSSENVLKVAK